MIKSSYIVNSALYVIMVFTAGIMWDRHYAVLFSIATAALAVLCADQFLVMASARGRFLVLLSWAVAGLSAIFLVWP